MESKDRRKFLGEAAVLASLSFLPSDVLAQADEQEREKLGAEQSGPAWLQLSESLRVVEWNPVELADGQEFTCTLSLRGSEFRSYVRRVDAGKTYSLFRYTALPNGKTAIGVINGTKGEQKGDYRLDTVQQTRIEADGTVVRQQPAVVRVLTTHPYAGLSPDETVQQFLSDKAAGRFE
jgi:hypothetical protein